MSSRDPFTPIQDAFVRHESSLKRFIGRLTRHSPDVEDITQEAFLRAFAVERDRAIEQPKSFLFRIAKHLALSLLTSKARQITDYLNDVGDDSNDAADREFASSAEEEVSAEQVLALHCEAVVSLSPQCRQVYLLRKVHGLSHKEIAAHLGIAVSTVEKHLLKGIEQCDLFVRDRTRPKGDAAPELSAAQRRGECG